MADIHVVLISQDHDLIKFVRGRFERPSMVTVLPSLRRRLPKPTSTHSQLFVIETHLAFSAGVAKVLRTQKNGASPQVFIGSPAQLISSCEQLGVLGRHHTNGSLAPGTDQAGNDDKPGRHAGFDLTLSDFMERKFHDVVKKIRHSGGKNIYALLHNEFEKPLISLALRETNGNQVQASYLLGVNRNTLRKKITELKIRVKH